MATNKILDFGASTPVASTLTDAQYAADADRGVGHRAGRARQQLVNKLHRQVSLVSSAIGDFIGRRQSADVVDSLTPQQLSVMLEAALKDHLSSDLVAVGSIEMWPAAAAIPDNRIRCHGQAVPVADYPDLFAIIGYAYGGSGANFRMPDYRNRFLRCAEDGTVGTARNGANAAHSHVVQGFSHTHGVSVGGHSHGVNDPSHGHGVSLHDPGHSHGFSKWANPGQASNDGNGVGSAQPQYEHRMSVDGSTTGISVGVQAAHTGISIQESGVSVTIHQHSQPVSNTTSQGSGSAPTPDHTDVIVTIKARR